MMEKFPPSRNNGTVDGFRTHDLPIMSQMGYQKPRCHSCAISKQQVLIITNPSTTASIVYTVRPSEKGNFKGTLPIIYIDANPIRSDVPCTLDYIECQRFVQ